MGHLAEDVVVEPVTKVLKRSGTVCKARVAPSHVNEGVHTNAVHPYSTQGGTPKVAVAPTGEAGAPKVSVVALKTEVKEEKIASIVPKSEVEEVEAMLPADAGQDEGQAAPSPTCPFSFY